MKHILAYVNGTGLGYKPSIDLYKHHICQTVNVHLNFSTSFYKPYEILSNVQKTQN